MIESTQNDKIKHVIRLLTDNRFRKKEGVFVLEGVQENERALQFNYEPVEYYICANIYKQEIPKSKVHFVSEKIYEHLAYRGGTEGIIGIYKTQEHSINHYQPSVNASIIVVESVEKPGNLGAILRSCEAFGIEALVITDSRVDIYNPNVIRSSVGCLFGMKIFQTNNEDLLEFLNSNNITIYTTLMSETAVELSKIDFKKKSALIFGTESTGLSLFWKEKGQNTLIPMSGTIDSLNLSNAVAISCYEIQSQKS